MGRQLDLERLALGRSAFQDLPADGEASNLVLHNAIDSSETDQPDGETYKQQYDSKGRPINPATEERNQTMRNAQNAALALVGVVERKETSDRDLEALQKARYRVLKAEHETGEYVDVVATVLSLALTWWPDILTARIEAGLYAGSMSFTDIVMQDLALAQYSGGQDLIDTVFAGLPLYVLCLILRNTLREIMRGGIGRLQGWLDKRLRHGSSQRVNHALKSAFGIIVVAIDITLLPLQFYADTQKLGLAPPRPLLPNLGILLPGNPNSVHSFIWTSNASMPAVAILSSPAVLLLLQNFMRSGQDESDQQEGILFSTKLSALDCPPINQPALTAAHWGIHLGPINKLFHQGYLIRSRILEWFGWDLEYIDANPRYGKEYENNHVPWPVSAYDKDQSTMSSESDASRRYYRSTMLSQLPAQYLADRMDELFTRLLLLPWEITVRRRVAASMLSSPLQQTSRSVPLAQNIFSPIGSGPVGLLQSSGLSFVVWQEIGSYISKLGLSLALNCFTEVGIFFVIYRLARWQGIRNFGWNDSEKPGTRRMGMNIHDTAQLDP